MQAIILAAGMGKRLKEYTRHNTKCMVKVGGTTLIERMLHQVERLHLSRIIIVVGYEGKQLIDYIETLSISTPIVFITNPIYDKTNNIYSLSLAKDWLVQEDTLLFESDIIFEDAVIDELVSDPRETLALVDNYEYWMNGTCVKLSEKDDIVEFITPQKFDFNNTSEYYKTVNIYKFSRYFSQTHYVPFLEAYREALGENEYYEQVLRVITLLDDPLIKGKRLSGQIWYEIDDEQDLDIAQTLFAPDDERLRLINGRFGGLWRYPKILDFCYLVNPYYPPQKMKDEISVNLDKLIASYPSGMAVNSLLAAKMYGVRRENIIVGNGAAELIKELMDGFSGITGFIKPKFEEYPNRYDTKKSLLFEPQNDDYAYSAKDIIHFYNKKSINNLVIVNPDNPSGNYITKEEMLYLIQWCGQKNIKLVVDESFVDFADEQDVSLINQGLLSAYTHLYVIKSISKSYGVPGIRLGILASGNVKAIEKLRQNVSIWNINSIGEFFLQINEKYNKDYEISLSMIRKERKRFQEELRKINGLRVIPSQANYVMVEIESGINAKEISKVLLNKHRLLVKDLTAKTDGKNYLRLAVRSTEDNDKLISAMKDVICCLIKKSI